MLRGCEAAGYRLAGADLEHICCRHLYGNDRMLVTWPTANRAVVLAVGPHDRSASDIYELLLVALGLEVPTAERTKPPCCDELGEPPVDAGIAETLAEAVAALVPRGRRRP